MDRPITLRRSFTFLHSLSLSTLLPAISTFPILTFSQPSHFVSIPFLTPYSHWMSQGRLVLSFPQFHPLPLFQIDSCLLGAKEGSVPSETDLCTSLCECARGFIWNILFLQTMACNADSNVIVLTSTITHRDLSVCVLEMESGR